MIEQKGMTFIMIIAILFLGGKRKGEKNNQSRSQQSCLSARSPEFTFIHSL